MRKELVKIKKEPVL